MPRRNEVHLVSIVAKGMIWFPNPSGLQKVKNTKEIGAFALIVLLEVGTLVGIVTISINKIWIRLVKTLKLKFF
jgi:hypothetical protein